MITYLWQWTTALRASQETNAYSKLKSRTWYFFLVALAQYSLINYIVQMIKLFYYCSDNND